MRTTVGDKFYLQVRQCCFEFFSWHANVDINMPKNISFSFILFIPALYLVGNCNLVYVTVVWDSKNIIFLFITVQLSVNLEYWVRLGLASNFGLEQNLSIWGPLCSGRLVIDSLKKTKHLDEKAALNLKSIFLSPQDCLRNTVTFREPYKKSSQRSKKARLYYGMSTARLIAAFENLASDPTCSRNY